MRQFESHGPSGVVAPASRLSAAAAVVFFDEARRSAVAAGREDADAARTAASRRWRIVFRAWLSSSPAEVVDGGDVGSMVCLSFFCRYNMDTLDVGPCLPEKKVPTLLDGQQ